MANIQERIANLVQQRNQIDGYRKELMCEVIPKLRQELAQKESILKEVETNRNAIYKELNNLITQFRKNVERPSYITRNDSLIYKWSRFTF